MKSERSSSPAVEGEALFKAVAFEMPIGHLKTLKDQSISKWPIRGQK